MLKKPSPMGSDGHLSEQLDLVSPAAASGHGRLRHSFVEMPGVGLARLVQLIAEGQLRPAIELEASWTEIASVAARLMERRFTGKAVLHL